MPEPFKNSFNKNIIRDMAAHFKNKWSEFDAEAFASAASNNLETLELKARSEQITDAMIRYLPADFEKAGEIVLASLLLHNISSFI